MSIFLAEIKGYDPVAGAEKTLYFSTRAMSPFRPDDSLRPNQFYEPRIVDIGPFTKSMFGSGRTSGPSASGGGEIILTNADQALDIYWRWGFSGRQCTVYVGEDEQDFAGFSVVMLATIEQPVAAFGGGSEATLSFRLRDKIRELDKPIQETLYLGTNATTGVYEGNADDLLDKPKPLCFGQCANVTPVLCNTTLYHYQVHDGAIDDIVAVYDKGDLITSYTKDVANGRFTLTAPPIGAITCDVKGAKPAGVYLTTAADIVKHIVVTYGGVAGGNVDAISISALNTANSAAVDIFVADTTTIITVLDQLLASVGGYWGFDHVGKFFVGRLELPGGTSLATFTDTDLIDLRALQSSDEQGNVPAYKVELEHSRLFTVQADGELAGAVTPARRLRLKTEYLTVVKTDITVKTVHLLAPVIKRRTLLTTGAAAEADRLLTLYKSARDFLAIVVPLDGATAALRLGNTITLKTSRLGMSAGKQVVITSSIPHSPKLNQIEFEVWG
jgi:hypothetical protein